MFQAAVGSNSAQACNVEARETAFGTLNIELDNINASYFQLLNRLTALKERVFGGAPGKEVGGPKPVPSGHVANISDKLDILKRILGDMSVEIDQLERIG